MHRSRRVHERVGTLTEKYDNIVNNLCEKMIVWNDFLKEKSGDDNNDMKNSTASSVDYESMKYAALRTLCKERGINAAGKKVDLIRKLKEAD